MGIIKEENLQTIYEQFLAKGQYVLMAKILVMFFVFILFFAFLEIDRVLGERKLEKLFFKDSQNRKNNGDVNKQINKGDKV